MKKITGNLMKRNQYLLPSALLSLAGTLCLPFMLNLKGNELAVSNSYFSVFCWAVCWFISEKSLAHTNKKDKRGFAAAAIFSLLFSACIAFGVQLDNSENVNFKSLSLWAGLLVWTVLLTFWVHRAFEWLSETAECRKQAALQPCGKPVQKWEPKWMQKWNQLTAGKQFLLTAIFFFLCWLPVFLAVYPGFFVYDAQDEFVQAASRNFTTHHPLPHVLLLGGIILAVHKLTDSYNAGIAVYTLVQMLFLSGVFAYVIYFMKKQICPFVLRAAAVLYFAFFPVIVMFSLCSAKDGIFTAALLMLVLSIIDMTSEKGNFFVSLRKMGAFCLWALVMMLFRHNGMYAFLVMVPVLIVWLKGYRKKLTLMLGLTFAAYFAVTAGLGAILSADRSENQELLTVPIQQIARTYRYNQDSFTEKEKQILYEVIPEKSLSYYTAKVSDGVKVSFNNEAYRADPFKYAALWIRKGLQHPFTYINAWLMTSYGFWYPDTVIDVYRGNSVFTFTYEDSSFFGYEVEQPGTRESRIPLLNEWYRKMSLEITQQKIPVVSMLFSPGFLFWVFAFAFGYTWYRRKYDLLPAFFLVLLVWMTVILGPTYLPRYVLILWFMLPVTAAVLVN